MAKSSTFSPEFQGLGAWVFAARLKQGLSQQELASHSKISQSRISGIEHGRVLPTLPQLTRLARALEVPLQWFINGEPTPGTEIPALALELRHLGIVDLLVPKATVPGAFRPTEQIVALAVHGSQPEPRIVEAIPAVLAWNPWYPPLLRAYSRRVRSRSWLPARLAGGCRAYDLPGTWLSRRLSPAPKSGGGCPGMGQDTHRGSSHPRRRPGPTRYRPCTSANVETLADLL